MNAWDRAVNWPQAMAKCDPVSDIRAWAREIYEGGPPEGPHRHSVPAAALYRPGTYTCLSCRAPVEVTIPLSEVC